MAARPMLRAAGRGMVAAALVLTVTEVVMTPPAHADDVIIYESPLVDTGGGGNVLVVSTPDLNISGSITVDNPGTTTPPGQQCLFISEGIGSYCLGSSDQLDRPDDIVLAPAEVQGPDSWPYRLPGESMDWMVDEAVAAIGATRGIDSPELIRTFARADIRAYVVGRLQTIVNKKLYGLALDAKETAAYKDLQAIFKEKLVQESKWSLEEYDRWNANPCGYTPPAPPAGLAEVANEAKSSSMCSSAGSRFAVWAFTKGTPETTTFDTWGAYRHPSPATKHLKDPKYQRAYSDTYGAAWLMGAYGATIITGAIITAALSTLSAASVNAVAGALGIWFPIAASSGGGFAATAVGVGVLIGGVVAALIAVLVTFAIAVWQLTEEAKKGAALRTRVTDSAADDDPLDVEKSAPDYVGLSFATLQDPADAAKKAYIHTEPFTTSLMALIQDWQLFTPSGTLIPDPTTGYAYTPSATDANVHFQFQGDPDVESFITVAAPPGTLDVDNRPLSGYRVGISHGMLMVSDLVTGVGFQPFVPRTRLAFLDAAGNTGWMALMQVGRTDGPPIRQFQIAQTDGVGGITNYGSFSWTFSSGATGMKTVTLAETLPVTPQVNVIPGIQGNLVADNLVQLDANLSTPGLSKTGGVYAWDVERLDAQNNVVEHIFQGNSLKWQHRFEIPGNYRAKVSYSWTGPEVGSVSGRIDFAIVRPAAQVDVAAIDDNRVADGSLTLDLRMSQNTDGDNPGDDAEFAVDVEWADDGLGNVVTEHYDVRCADAGADTCDTGPLIDQPTGGPTNPNWSTSPNFTIPDGQNFLPHVTVRITNSYGETITRVFEITGEHRPTYATMTPYVQMAAGKHSDVDLVEIFPSGLLPGSKNLQINPFVLDIAEQLPPGVIPDIVHRDIGLPTESWWLQLQGVPTADDIGQWTFYYPFEQETEDFPRRPAPALATVEIVSSTTPGYRGILRNVPQDLGDRFYREAYPDWMVQAAQVLDDGEEEFTDFTGTVMCKLEAGPNTIFDKPCAQNQPFPWPAELFSDSLVASVRTLAGGQPVSGDGEYVAQLFTSFLEPTVTLDPVGAGDANVTVRMHLEDNAVVPRVIPPPFSAKGFTVSCSLDGAAYVPCLDSGVATFAKTPLDHTLDVKTQASDGATVIKRVTWNGGPVPPAPPVVKTLSAALTALPAAKDALKAKFSLAVGYGGGIAPPYAAKGFTVTCMADGAKPAPCFDNGSLELLRVPGKHQLSVTVKATDGQTSTQSLAWTVATPKKKLTVKAPATAERGEKIKVKAKGLLPREKFVIVVGKVKLAKGLANDLGRVVKKVKISTELGLGKIKVVVRGATKKRTGSDVVKVAAPTDRAVDPRLDRILV